MPVTASTRRYCQNCLCYHTDEQGCPTPAAQKLPAFQGTAQDYEIATRGQHTGGQLDDAMDGSLIVRWGMAEYRVHYSMGVPTRVELFAQRPVWND